MDENRTPQDFRKTNNANRTLMFRVLAIGVVLYWLFEIVMAYFKGGADAPSLTLLIVAIVVLGGGAVLIGWLTYKVWKEEQRAAQLTEEEMAQLEALRAEDEHED